MTTATGRQVFTTGEAAKRLGLPAWRVVSLIGRGILPEVSRLGILRSWTAEDIATARKALAEAGVATEGGEQR